jgi:hypothetical protein
MELAAVQLRHFVPVHVNPEQRLQANAVLAKVQAMH